eukprot:343023_1
MASSIDLKSLKDIDIHTEYTVYGFIRQFQKILGLSTWHIIPPLVYKICLAFYTVKDEWNVNKIGDEVIIKDRTITYKSAGLWHTVYGTMKCKYPNKYTWEMRIESLASRKEIMIGIADINTNYQNHDVARANAFLFWSWNSGTCSYRDTVYRTKGYGKVLVASDIIKMTLDLRNNSLSFMINNKDYGVVIDDIPSDKEYNLVVSLGDPGTTLTLLYNKW